MKPAKRILMLLLFVAVATAAGEVNLKTDVGNMFFAARNTASEAQEDTREFLEASKAKESNHGLGTGARKELSETKEIIKGAESALEGRQNQATQPTMTQHEYSTLAKLRAELKDIHKSYTHDAPARSYTSQNSQTASSEAKRYEAIRAAAKNQRKIMSTSQMSSLGSDDTSATAKQARQERALQEKYDKLVADLGGAGDVSEASVQEVVEEQSGELSNNEPVITEIQESSASPDELVVNEVSETSSAATAAAVTESDPQEQESSTSLEQPAFESENQVSETSSAATAAAVIESDPQEQESSTSLEQPAFESENQVSETSSEDTKDETTNTNTNNNKKPNQTAANGKETSTATRPSSVRVATRKPLALKKLSTTMAHILESVNRRVVEPVIVPEPLYAYRLQQTLLDLSKEGLKLTNNVSRENKKKWEKEVRTELENLNKE